MTPEQLRTVFDAPEPLTVGLEEELMLLDPVSLDLTPHAREAVAAAGDERFKLELSAAQVESTTAPARSVAAAGAQLADARRTLAAATAGRFRLAGAGVHPFAAPRGVLTAEERYEWMAAEYGDSARRQLVFSLQVHVAVGDADATLPVYNALRSHLPDLAALAANAPFHAGRDSHMASVRPELSLLLPRQGVPPVLADWEEFAAALRWGARSGRFPEPGQWWWELRPHTTHGTLEVRVCDTQTTVAASAALAALAQSLVADLAARHAAGEPLPAAPSWRIAENRSSAQHHGVHGQMHDLVTGEAEPTRRRLHRLLEELAPTAARLDCETELESAAGLIEAGGADRQRAVAGLGDLRRLVSWLADAFLAGT